MKLKTYLQKRLMTAVKLADHCKVSKPMVYQWKEGIRKVPKDHCETIEKVTGGVVARHDLRPDDWQEIWPRYKIKPRAAKAA